MISYADRSSCRNARLCYYDLLDEGAEANVPEEIRRHVASCEHCQADISRLEDLLSEASKPTDSEQKRRDSILTQLLSLHFSWAGKPVTCESARPFLPSLADPLLRIRIPTPITVHVDKCRRCAEELADIEGSEFTHEQLCRLGKAVAERSPEEGAEEDRSGVTTCFTLRKPDSPCAPAESDDMYAAWPIEVRVLDRTESLNPGTDSRSAPLRETLILNLRRHLKPAIAAAALILIGLAVFFGTSPAKAVNLRQLYEAVTGAENVHIMSFAGDQMEQPYQERWVSRSLSTSLLKTGQQLTLCDLRGEPKMIEGAGSAAPTVVLLTRKKAEEIRSVIRGTLGILPFRNWSEVRGGAELKKIEVDVPEDGTEDCEVYDLTWSGEPGFSQGASTRWRFFVDSRTGRPRKAKFYEKLPADGDYRLASEYRVKYMSEDEMKAVIDQASLQGPKGE